MPPDETPEVVTIADEVAAPMQELINSAEQFTLTGAKVPFAAARLLVEKGRLALDALETSIRNAAGPR